VGLAAIFALALARSLYRRLPVFFVYLSFEIVQSVVLGLLRCPPYAPGYSRFFFTYWACQLVEVGLGFAVIYELFAQAFRPYQALRHFGLVLFRVGAIALFVVAIVMAAWGPGKAPSHLFATIFFLDRSVSIVQCGLMFFLFVFSSYLGLTWRHQLLGIALGFGLIASAELASSTVWLQWGTRTAIAWDFIRRGAYDVALIIWIAYLVPRETSPAPVRVLPLNDFAEWDAAILHMLQR
jgi:hypothetical protein